MAAWAPNYLKMVAQQFPDYEDTIILLDLEPA